MKAKQQSTCWKSRNCLPTSRQWNLKRSIFKRLQHLVSPFTTSLITEIDEAFKSAAIYGLYQIKSSNSQNAMSFPLLSSTLVSSHLNPYLPEGFEQYTFKKTSWKKAATFLKKYLEKEGVVKTKDRGGDTVILSINWDSKLITEFQPYDLAKKQSEKAPKQTATLESSSLVNIQELYRPSGKTLKILLELRSKKSRRYRTC